MAQEALRASRIQQTLNSVGWPDIMEIVQNKYNDSMDALLKKESPEARGAINALTEIFDDISADLQFGENARQKYIKENSEIKRPAVE